MNQTNNKITFSLKTRRKRDKVTGIEQMVTKHLPIVMRTSFCGKDITVGTGHFCDYDQWDSVEQRVSSSDENDMHKLINNDLSIQKGILTAILLQHVNDEHIDKRELIVTTFRSIMNKCNRILYGIPESQDTHANKCLFEALNEFKKVKGDEGFWGQASDEKCSSLRHHFVSFEQYIGMTTTTKQHVTFGYFDEKGIQLYMEYLLEEANLCNNTILKHFDFFRQFFRWALKHKYHNNQFAADFKPNFRKYNCKVIFLSCQELYRLIHLHIPKKNKGLEQSRDLFLFSCATGMRYSDVKGLYKCDVNNLNCDFITVKTKDRLIVELNTFSRTIIEKYKDCDFPDGKLLPVISNQKLNENLKKLCRMAKINSDVHMVKYKGNERIDIIEKKYKLITTHAGRRTFICMMLSLNIPPHTVMKWTGHRSYKDMLPYIDTANEFCIEAMNKFDDFWYSYSGK